MVVGFAQSNKTPLKTVAGKVTDAATGAAVPGVRVQSYGNERYSAMTGEDGSYTINVPEYVTSLILKVEGYNLQQTPINNRAKGVDAALFSDLFAEQYQNKTVATSSKSAVGFDLSGDINIAPQIQSKLGAEVHTNIRSGLPGVGGVMFMNGLNSLSANAQPLIVLDGVLLEMQYDRSMIHDGYYNDLLSNLNIVDIEKVTVIHNGTALYGAKGGNGVLLIDTKRNKSMATIIDFSMNGSFELTPNLPSMMDASQYRSYASELLGSTGTTLTEFKFLKVDENYYYYNQYHNNTDWSKQVYQNAFSQNYSINVQGGDDVADYNLSVGYSNGQSTLMKNDFSRFNLRLNSDIRLFKGVTARFDASFSDVQRNLRDDGVTDDFKSAAISSPGFLSLIKSPFLNPYAYDTQGRLSGFYAQEDDYLDEVIGKSVSLANPSSILKYGEAKNKNSFSNNLITLAITPKYQVNKNLFMSEHFCYTSVNTYENYYLPITGVPTLTVDQNGNIYNVAQSLSSHHNGFFSDTRVVWNKQYGASNVHVLGSARFVNNTYDLNLQKGYNTGNDKMPNMSLSLYNKTTSGADDISRSLTYYVHSDYNFQEKYYLTGALSMETSSMFGRDALEGIHLGGVAWGLFPSLQASWVMSSEPWFKADRIAYLKWNLGFDVTGNDDLDYTASRSYFTANKILNAIDGLSIGNIGNTTLQWETTKRLTGGLDMNLFNNNLNVQANVYKGWTSNLLTLKDLAYNSGLPSIWTNDGSLENTGYMVSFNAKLLNSREWKMEWGGSVSHYTNKVTALSNNNEGFNTEIYGATVRTQVGSPVGVFYGYETEGVYPTAEKAAADGYYVVTKTGDKAYFGAGDMKFKNRTNDQVIDEADRTVIGDPNPDVFGNVFTNLHYRHFTLNVVMNYSLGGDVFNYQRSILESGSRFFNQTTAMNNRWTAEGQNTVIPRIQYGDVLGNSRFSDRWIEDGSYARLKNVTLSYNLPMNNTYIKGLTVWGTASNLFTWTNYLGNDPEFSLGNSVLAQGIDRGLLAQGRTFVLGVRINL
jgi:TonB-linked SusC/RagA family outer membrane protein